MELVSVRKLSKSGKGSSFPTKFGFEESYVRRWDGAQKLTEMHGTPHRYKQSPVLRRHQPFEAPVSKSPSLCRKRNESGGDHTQTHGRFKDLFSAEKKVPLLKNNPWKTSVSRSNEHSSDEESGQITPPSQAKAVCPEDRSLLTNRSIASLKSPLGASVDSLPPPPSPNSLRHCMNN